jgi:ribonuclease R
MSAAPTRNRTAEGTLQVHPNAFGFVRIDADESAFIPPGMLEGALDGDRVELIVRPAERGLEGRIVRIVERKRKSIVGTLVKIGRRGVSLVPDDPRLHCEIELPNGRGAGLPGEVVVARIDRYPHPRDSARTLVCEVVRSLGEPGTLSTEIARILVDNGIDETFPDDVEAEARVVPQAVRPEDLDDREDLRGVPFMTIDPDDARDFDDAVAAKVEGRDPAKDDIRIHVAVADVSHYVRIGTAIDREAAWRCFSTYLPDRAIPMLPEQLSSHMCSLRPDEERLAMVVTMKVTASGEVREPQYMAAVIRSRKRLTYGDVARELAGDHHLPEEIAERVLLLRRVSDRLRAKRMRRGSIELTLPETKVVLDQDDPERIRDVVASRATPEMARAYNLIEELMLAANEAVGAVAADHGLVLPFRVHATPDPDRLAQLAIAAAALGIDADPELLEEPRGVQKFLGSIEGHPRATALNYLMLRAMAQAEYRLENVGHFALAAEAYVHFTSPIRRYPDLLAHRTLKHFLSRRGGHAGPRPLPPLGSREQILAQSIRSGDRERASAQAERDARQLYAAAFMRDRIGERFTGTITGVTNNGAYVSLGTPAVDGFVRLAQISTALQDDFEVDETGVRLFGHRRGLVLTIGDRVLVEVENVSLSRRQVELALIEHVEGYSGRGARVDAGMANVPRNPNAKTGRGKAGAPRGAASRGAASRGAASHGAASAGTPSRGVNPRGGDAGPSRGGTAGASRGPSRGTSRGDEGRGRAESRGAGGRDTSASGQDLRGRDARGHVSPPGKPTKPVSSRPAKPAPAAKPTKPSTPAKPARSTKPAKPARSGGKSKGRGGKSRK